MPKHANLVANGPKYKDNLLKYFNSIPDAEKKIDFLYGFIYAAGNANDALSNEEDRALMDVMDAFRAPVKSETNGQKQYDLAAAERNTRAFIKRKLQGNLALGRKLRQNKNGLPESLENRDIIAAYQTRCSMEMITTDQDDYIYKMLSAGNTQMSSQLRETTGKDWGEHYEKWLKEETDSYLSKLQGDDLTDYQNGVALLGDEPKMLKNQTPEAVGLSRDNLNEIRNSNNQQFWEKYGDFSYRSSELHASLDKFNSKRFWGIGSWWSDDPSVGKETAEHKDLKDSTRKLIEAINFYDKVRYLPDTSIETKLSLAEVIKDLTLEVQQNEVQYEINKKAKPASPAGKDRIDGAKEIKTLAIGIQQTIEQDINTYTNELHASKSVPEASVKEEVPVKTEVPIKEEVPVQPQSPAKNGASTINYTKPIRPVRQFEMESTGQVEILGKSAAKEKQEQKRTSAKKDTRQQLPIVPEDKAFKLSEVTIYPEMRALMLEYADMAQDYITINANELGSSALKDSLTKVASQKGTENLQEFKDICNEVKSACQSYKSSDEKDIEIVKQIEDYQSSVQDYINKAYYKKRNLAIKANDAIDNTIQDYGKVLNTIREAINNGDNSPQLKSLEEAVLKITESGPDISRQELMNLAQDVTAKTADFSDDPKYDHVIEKCLKAEDRLNKRFTKLNLSEIASREKDSQYQKQVEDHLSKSKSQFVIEPQRSASEAKPARTRSTSNTKKETIVKPAMNNII